MINNPKLNRMMWSIGMVFIIWAFTSSNTQIRMVFEVVGGFLMGFGATGNWGEDS